MDLNCKKASIRTKSWALQNCRKTSESLSRLAKKSQDGKTLSSVRSGSVRCSPECGGDHHEPFFPSLSQPSIPGVRGGSRAAIVLGEIAHHNILRLYSRRGDSVEVYKKAADYRERMKHFEPTNAFSISQATGIPRETARGKIDKLGKKGWVVKNDRGEVFISETVSERFTRDFNKKILSELLETSGSILRLLQPDSKNQEK